MLATRPALTFALTSLVVACSPTLPAAPAHAFVPPAPRSPPMELCWIEFSINDMPGSYGLAAESEHRTWDITYSGLLVRHPKGDLLVDAGNSSHFADEIDSADFVHRILLRLYPGAGEVVASAPAALRRAGEEPSRLSAIALSHVHADHAGGLLDLPGTPVVVSSDELAFIGQEKDRGGFDVVQAHGRAIEGRARPIRFARVPYATFDESFDFFGDGSVVFVPLPGHTPGSMGTFVSPSIGHRFFHVGDAVNTLEAVEKRRGKSAIMQITDHDGSAADATAARISQLHDLDGALAILPAHDRSAWLAAFGAPGRCTGFAGAAPR